MTNFQSLSGNSPEEDEKMVAELESQIQRARNLGDQGKVSELKMLLVEITERIAKRKDQGI